MPFSRRKLCNSLRSKGFVQTEGSNHTVLSYEPGGTQTPIATSVSRGSDSSEIDESLAYDEMKGQLGLKTNGEFDRLVECPMGALEYYNTLVERGEVDGKSIQPSSTSAVGFTDSQVEAIQEELVRRMDENYDDVQSEMWGKIDENGKLEIEDVRELEECGVFSDAGVNVDL